MRKLKIITASYLSAALIICGALFILWRGASSRLAQQTESSYVSCTASLCSGAGQIGALLRGAAEAGQMPNLEASMRLRDEIVICRGAIARFPQDLGADALGVDAYFETVYRSVALPVLRGSEGENLPSDLLLALSAHADAIAEEMEALSVYYLQEIKKPATDLSYRSAAAESFSRMARVVSTVNDAAARVSQEPLTLPGMSVHEARAEAGDIIGPVAAYLTGTGTVSRPLSAFCFYCGNYYVTVDKISGRLLSLAAAFGAAAGDIGQDAAVQKAISFIEGRTECAFAPVGMLQKDGVMYLRAAPADGANGEILIGVRCADGRICLYDATAYYQRS